jgi:hypothetical protein
MRAGRWVVVAVGATVLGCGPDGPELHPVTGKVELQDGRPVAGAMVEFAAEGGFGARGKTNTDGRFELSHDGRKGAAVGRYRVAIVHMVVADGAVAHKPGHGWLAIHPKYARLDTSQLSREVKAGPNDFTFEVEPAGERPRGW